MTKRNSTISWLKLTSTIIVFFCHCYMECKNTFSFELEPNWQIFLKTPAWAGVWIFFIISGYLAGKGFFSGKYTIDKKGFTAYYLNKLKTLIFPTFVFISLAYIFFGNKEAYSDIPLFRLITLTYNGIGGIQQIGPTWYVFTLIWLHIFTPLFVLFIRKCENTNTQPQKNYWYLLFIVMTFGLCLRCVVFATGAEWYTYAYTNPICNVDLFYGGIITAKLSTINDKKTPSALKPILFTMLGILLAINCIIYYYGEGSLFNDGYYIISFYRYYMPSIYLLLVSTILLTSKFRTEKESPLTRFINKASDYTFHFYLWHSTILARISQIVPFTQSLANYFFTLIVSAAITIFLSYIMTHTTEALTSKTDFKKHRE